jgi:AraC family transcriptional activator of pobA
LDNSNMPSRPVPNPSAIMTAARARAREALPAYQLYGEQGPGLADRLHCESIAERSRLHGWEIRPHRHAQLFQCLVIERGLTQAQLDGQVVELSDAAVVTVPAAAVHGFRFAPDTEGTVVTVHEAHLQALLQVQPALFAALCRLRAQPLPAQGPDAAAAGTLHAALGLLRDEVQRHQPWRAAALDAALLQLTVALVRALPPGPSRSPGPALVSSPAPPRAQAHVQALRQLVDQHFRQQPTQAQLAGRLGITPTQLNRACQQVLGHSAQAVLHARLLLQAQRELAYSGLSVKQIAFDLGFSDAAYFTRFFRRLAGCSPGGWRAAQAGL